MSLTQKEIEKKLKKTELIAKLALFKANQGTSYLVYTAIINQTGTNPPTAIVSENTLGGTVIYGYDDVGNFRGTLAGAFPQNKTFINFCSSGFFVFGAGRNDNNSFYLTSHNHDGTPINDSIIEQSLEIRVYP